jgi:hypothetical protein
MFLSIETTAKTLGNNKLGSISSQAVLHFFFSFQARVLTCLFLVVVPGCKKILQTKDEEFE